MCPSGHVTYAHDLSNVTSVYMNSEVSYLYCKNSVLYVFYVSKSGNVCMYIFKSFEL